MGYVTTINFLNDAGPEIRQNKEQVIENILNAMNNTSEKQRTYGIGYNANPMSSARSVHADIPQLHLNWCNSFITFGRDNDVDDSMLDVRKSFLYQAKQIIKEEELLIKKIEGKRPIDNMDISKYSNEVKTFGKYKVYYNKDVEKFVVVEKNNIVLQDDKDNVIKFINTQIK